jgi:hypothetical protein
LSIRKSSGVISAFKTKHYENIFIKTEVPSLCNWIYCSIFFNPIFILIMSIRAKQKFYNQAVTLGIDLKDLDVERLDFSGPVKHKSSFKKRAKEVKEMYNYRFPSYVEPRSFDFGLFNIEFKRK